MLQLVHSCTISRNAVLGTNGRHQMQVLYTNVSCLALPMNTKTEILNKFELGRGYDFYFAPTQDVKGGDVFTYNGDTYSAEAIQFYNVPLVGYIHALAKQEAST